MSLISLYNGDKRVKMKPDQTSSRNIGQVFGLFPDSIFLISEDGSVEIPDETGMFFPKTFYRYEVNGDNIVKTPESKGIMPSYQSSSSGASSSSVTPRAQRLQKGISQKSKWPPKPPGVTAKINGEEWTRPVEIYQYTNGTLHQICNWPVTLTEQIASTTDVSLKLSREAFGGASVILLDHSNLQIPDTIGSKGYKFSKPGKKVKALTEEDYQSFAAIHDDPDDADFEAIPPPFKKRKSITRAPIQINSSSEDEFESSTSCKRPKGKSPIKLYSRFNQLEERLQKLEKNHADELNNPTQDCPELKIIEDLFRCFICKSIISKNCSCMPCCSHMTCFHCLQQWKEAVTTPNCPMCRATIDAEASVSVDLPRNVISLLEILSKNNSTGESSTMSSIAFD